MNRDDTTIAPKSHNDNSRRCLEPQARLFFTLFFIFWQHFYYYLLMIICRLAHTATIPKWNDVRGLKTQMSSRYIYFNSMFFCFCFLTNWCLCLEFIQHLRAKETRGQEKETAGVLETHPHLGPHVRFFFSIFLCSTNVIYMLVHTATTIARECHNDDGARGRCVSSPRSVYFQLYFVFVFVF
jgi:hypothetical protein